MWQVSTVASGMSKDDDRMGDVALLVVIVVLCVVLLAVVGVALWVVVEVTKAIWG